MSQYLAAPLEQVPECFSHDSMKGNYLQAQPVLRQVTRMRESSFVSF
jgi:hypothetical protein